MSKAFQKIAQGLKQAIAISRGEASPAKLHNFVAGTDEDATCASCKHWGDQTYSTFEQPESRLCRNPGLKAASQMAAGAIATESDFMCGQFERREG